MPSFSLKDGLRRASRSFQSQTNLAATAVGEDASSGSSEGSRVKLPTTKSTSTLNSFFGRDRNGDGARTPPSQTESSNSSTIAPVPSNHPTNSLQLSPSSASLISRPPLTANGSKRQSVAGMSGLGYSAVEGIPVSQYAPRVVNVADGTAVFGKTLLISGTIGDSATQSVEGTLSVGPLEGDSYPTTHWPVSESHFKCLVQLNPGYNRLRFSFNSPKLANSNSSNNIHASILTLNYIPQTHAPPLHLVILLAKDSPGTYDAVPARVEREGNGIDTAVAKYRMAGNLWQAFTAEQMARNKLGRRTFRFEEEWTSGTSYIRDRQAEVMRSEPKVHIVRSEKTLAEMRDVNVAQQNPAATNAGALFSWAMDDMRRYFNLKPGQRQHCAVLLLDAHWDKQQNMLLGHAALGGGDGGIQLAVFGSHALQSYPATFDEIVPAFTDCTRTDMDHVANDCNESGSNWEACNIGVGAHLHEVGHLFGCPHQESGIMLRDYTKLNRTFTVREAYSTRTSHKGGLVLANDECNWHKLDLLRFRCHPAFRLAPDPILHKDDSVNAWPVEDGVFLIAPSGLAFTEIKVEGESFPTTWIEHGNGNGRGPIQKQYLLTEEEIRFRLPEHLRKKKVTLSAKSFGGGSANIEAITASKAVMLKTPGKKKAYRGVKHGNSAMEGSEKQEIIFRNFDDNYKLMTGIKVYYGLYVDGLEFCYEDGENQLFGKRTNPPAEFGLDTRRGEIVSGFNIRAGAWIDGLQIITSYGRLSDFFGNPTGGHGANIMPPRGWNIAGISGSAGPWLDGFQGIIGR